MSASTISTPQATSYYGTHVPTSPTTAAAVPDIDLDALLSGFYDQGHVSPHQDEQEDAESMPGSMFMPIAAAQVHQHADDELDQDDDADDNDDVRSAFVAPPSVGTSSTASPPTAPFDAYGALPPGASQWDASSDEDEYDLDSDASPRADSDMEEGEVRSAEDVALDAPARLHEQDDEYDEADTARMADALLALIGATSDDDDDAHFAEHAQDLTVDDVLGKYVLPAIQEEIPAATAAAPSDLNQDWLDALLADTPEAPPQPHVPRFAPLALPATAAADTASRLPMPEVLQYDAAPPTPRVPHPGSDSQRRMFGPQLPPPSYFASRHSTFASPVHAPARLTPRAYSDDDAADAPAVDWQQHRVIQSAPGRAGKLAGGVRGGARKRKVSSLLLGNALADATSGSSPNGGGGSSPAHLPRVASPQHTTAAAAAASPRESITLYPWDDPHASASLHTPTDLSAAATMTTTTTTAPPMFLPPNVGIASEIGKVVAYDPQLAAKMARYGWI